MLRTNLTDLPLFKDYLRNKRLLAESTVYCYCQVLECFLKNDPDLSSIDSYNDFIIEKGIKKRTTYVDTVLKEFIKWKIDDRKLRYHLTENLIKAKMKRNLKYERVYLSEEKILDIINSLKEKKHRVIAIIQHFTGVRAGDILKLHEGQLSPEEYKGNPILRFNILGKGDKRAVVSIHDKVAQQIIWEYIMNNNGMTLGGVNYYFLAPNKYKSKSLNTWIPKYRKYRLYRLNYRWYFEDLKIALENNGVNKKDFATHDFRRCFARRVWERYKDIHVLKNLLHHEYAETTLRYLKQSGLDNIEYFKQLQTE